MQALLSKFKSVLYRHEPELLRQEKAGLLRLDIEAGVPAAHDLGLKKRRLTDLRRSRDATS